MKDPQDMTDEELAAAIAPPETNEELESPEEQPQQEEEAPATEEVEQPEGEGEASAEEEEQPVSRREQLRVASLLQKYPQLKEQPSVQRPAVTPKQDDFLQNLDAEPEVIQQLEANRQAYSDEAFAAGMKIYEVREWRRELKHDAPIVEKAYPFLDPTDAEHFKPAAANAMNQKYLRFIGWDPGDATKDIPETVQISDLSYKEFVDSEMEFVDELANQKVAETTKNLAKQAASTGLRPDGSSAKRMNLNQAPENMTVEELYAAIGQTPPKST